MKSNLPIMLLLTFLIPLIIGCTAIGFATGNIIDEHYAIKKASVSDTLFSDCKNGDIVLLTDNSSIKYLGKVEQIIVSKSISLIIWNNKTEENDKSSKLFIYSDIKSIHIVRSNHFGMVIGTILGIILDMPILLLILSPHNHVPIMS